MLVSLLFSVVPLLHVRFVKPSLLLRDEARRGGRDWARLRRPSSLVSAALVGADRLAGGVAARSAWSSAPASRGSRSCCMLAGRLLVALIAPLANSRSFPLRHAVLHLSRPGNQTRVILLAVGLGAFFIVGVRSLQASLLEEFSIQTAADSPDMFLMDIQRGQADGDARVPARSGARRGRRSS